jgi:hypothetical protein
VTERADNFRGKENDTPNFEETKYNSLKSSQMMVAQLVQSAAGPSRMNDTLK